MSQLFQGIEDPPHVVIEFLNRIAVIAPVRLALKFLADAESGLCSIVCGRVQKKRFILVLLDKSDGLIGIELREFRGIGRALDDLAVPY